MFRFLFRFAGPIYISRVGATWVNIHPNSLSGFEPAVETLQEQ